LTLVPQITKRDGALAPMLPPTVELNTTSAPDARGYPRTRHVRVPLFGVEGRNEHGVVAVIDAHQPVRG
jgi:hypothetical protein